MGPRNKSEGDGWRSGVRVVSIAMLAVFITLTLAACGRKDVPDYPPDATERPGTLPPRRESIRYY